MMLFGCLGKEMENRISIGAENYFLMEPPQTQKRKRERMERSEREREKKEKRTEFRLHLSKSS